MSVNAKIALSVLIAFGVLGLLATMGILLVIGMAREQAGRRAGSVGSATATALSASGWTLIGRGLARRCPACGRGTIFRSHFKMNPVCSECGVVFWKNQGEWLGPAIMDYTVAGGSALIAWAATAFFGFSEYVQLGIAAAAATLASIGLAPWSRSLWTVLLYMFGEMDVPEAKRLSGSASASGFPDRNKDL